MAASPPAGSRVKELMTEDESRPRSDSTGSRTRSWSGVDFDTPGRPRTFSLERGEKKVVVLAVDASKAAENAFQWFLDNLCSPEFFLVLLHIPEIPPPPLVDYVGIRPGDMSFSSSIWEGTFEEEKAKVGKLKSFYEKKLIEHGVSGKWLTLSTSKKPGEAIVKAVKEYKPALVVMGARGISSFRKTLMGSVSDYVLHHAHVPVIICKHHH